MGGEGEHEERFHKGKDSTTQRTNKLLFRFTCEINSVTSSILDGCCHAKMQVSLHLDVLVTVFICSRVVRSISSCLGLSLRPFWTQTSWTFIASLLAVRYLAQPLGFVLYVAVPLWEPGFLDFHRVLLGNQVSWATFGVVCCMSPCPLWASGILDFHRVLVGSQGCRSSLGPFCWGSSRWACRGFFPQNVSRVKYCNHFTLCGNGCLY